MRHNTALLLVLGLPALGLAAPDGVGHHGDHGAGHHADHGAAVAQRQLSGYEQPSTSYDQPSTGYDQPSTGYDQPSTGYDQPSYAASTGYDQPSYEGYAATAPGTGYGDPAATTTGGFDLSTLLIPVLIIAGLALLFPQVVNVPVNGARRKREAGDTLVGRVQSIYLAVLESEECMERVACEVGGLAADQGLDKGITRMAESFMPKKYQKMMKNFNSAKDCHKIKCGAF